MKNDRNQPLVAGRHQSVRRRSGAERQAERGDREGDKHGHEPGRLEVSSNERPAALPTEDQGERAIERTVDGHRRKERSDNADRQRETPTLHEVVGDAGFLRGRGRVDLAKDLDQIALGAIGAVHKGEDADEQGKERDEREKNLVRDRAGEEAALVLGEARDGGPRASNGAG